MASYYGLKNIGKRMGKSSRTIVRWRQKLGFKLLVSPTDVLCSQDRYWTDDNLIRAWELALANARDRAMGRVFDQELDCPLCGRPGNAHLRSEGSDPYMRYQPPVKPA